ncbi:hypothetical protein FQN50_004622 [Emmonsiellopsis sp. PD_5]|nr:hypothetical protein FQN50_004622 [Emmonsiellopsis sp. PD_5]
MEEILAKATRRVQELFRDFLALLKRMVALSSRPSDSSRPKRRSFSGGKRRRRTLDDLAQEVKELFTGHLNSSNLLSMSKNIRTQINAAATSSPISMLPSFNHTLPTGKEKGTYVALDVGGSTFRVALVELSGDGHLKIVRMKTCPIDETIKLLEGKAFFEWMAERIEEMLHDGQEKYGHDSEPAVMGMSWSFPIDQTSVRSGRVLSMGKGFLCSNGTTGQDLAELIMEACRERNLNVEIHAILNDSSATLLSRAYTDTLTRASLILGTGTNAAIHFPVHAIGIDKFGSRPAEWFAQANNVIVNTELSMFGGKGALPTTPWDDLLNRTHLKPDYQPLEYMCTGRYLGEIVRLIMVDAVKTAGLFSGLLPDSLRTPYSFDTAIPAFIQEDTSPSLSASSAYLQKHHNFVNPPSPSDLQFLKQICGYVTTRAAAYIATAIHALWCLRNSNEDIPPTPDSSMKGDQDLDSLQTLENAAAKRQSTSSTLNVSIACEGAVISKYPGFREQCQQYLNELTMEDKSEGTPPTPPLSPGDSEAASPSKKPISSTIAAPTIMLDLAPESAIFGAAVAVAVAVAQN